MIENLGQTHKQLKLKFEGNETIYRSWAEISFRFEIVAKPKAGKKNRLAKEETVVSEFTAIVHFLKKEKRWTLIEAQRLDLAEPPARLCGVQVDRGIRTIALS